MECFGKSRLVDDLASPDFEKLRAQMARTRGPLALGNEMQRVRSVFKLAFDEGLIDRPLRFGAGLDARATPRDMAHMELVFITSKGVAGSRREPPRKAS